MKLRQEKGFTLIELLVVIAIIGILSSVVLAALNSARGKSVDAKVKAQLAQVKNAATIYYDNNSQSYGIASTDCTGADGSIWGDTTSGMNKYTDATNYNGAKITCDTDGTNWAVSGTLPGASGGTPDSVSWCVDSNGTSKQTDTSGGLGTDISGSLCS